MAVPAALITWLLLHLFVTWWRRVGPVATYVVIGAVVIAMMWTMYLVREPLLEVHFGVRIPLMAISVVLLSISTYINVLVYKQAPKSMVLGLGEISKRSPGGELVTDGIYSRIRHPRFVAMALAVIAVSIFTNFFAMYVLAIAYFPLIFLIAVLEERELSARFGSRFEEYARAVPPFLPRIFNNDTYRKGAT
jgi:protein-S-isoprenylcysteine O-methyltransferase Ste14